MSTPRLHRRDSMDASELVQNQREGTVRSAKEGLDVRVLGVCTGSGLNALECALVRYRQDAPNAPLRVELLQYTEIAVSPTVRTPILNSLRDTQSRSSEVQRLNMLLGHMFSNGIKTFCQNYNIVLESINLVGTHTPALRRYRRSEMDNPTTHPLGWNSIIAAETGLTVVFDFAVFDGAIGRPNPSLTAFVDKLFLRHPSKFRVCLNIGELVNLSFIPPLVDSNAGGMISRDCGPGSLLIDYAMRYCTSNDHLDDYDGKYAAPGKVNQDIVDRFLYAHDYLRALPPLSIAREMFGDHEAQRCIDECLFVNMSEVDTIATITRITAQNILKQYLRIVSQYFPQDLKVDELFICGPSARNSNIIDYLEAELPESVITKPLNDVGIPGDANEAVSFAHLALEAVLGQTSRPPTSSTSAPIRPGIDVVRGRVLRGTTWGSLSSQLLKFSDGKQLPVTRDVRVAGNLETAISSLGLR